MGEMEEGIIRNSETNKVNMKKYQKMERGFWIEV
jgi:hypothetical protein